MLTNQEMFDRAVKGLASQGWEQARNSVGGCMYLTPDGKRCAWGWVDPEGTVNSEGKSYQCYLGGLRSGLAAKLVRKQVGFAIELQGTHDNCGFRISASALKAKFRLFGEKHGLVWPLNSEPSEPSND